jgi:anaerobic magnesium-protoporphyrin IX monomethyl ester cyclase
MNNIQLISPPLIAYEGDIFGMIPSPPIGVASLAAYIRENGFEVSLLDCFGESPCVFEKYREGFVRIGLGEEDIIERIDRRAMLIGISIHSGMVASFCLHLALEIKKRLNKQVVVGGPHVSVNYMDFLKRGVDYAVVGEGEGPLLNLLERISTGGECHNMPGLVSCRHREELIPNELIEMDKLPFPAWDLVPLENYWSLKMSHSPVTGKFAPMITSRGCPFNCSFCNTPEISGRKWRSYNPERLLREIKHLKENLGVREIFIQDDNFTIDPQRVINICNLLEKESMDVRFSLPSGIRLETINPEMINTLARGGFHYLCLAPESGSPKIRNLMKKPLDETKLFNVQKQCKRRAIRTGAFVIIGIPGENISDIFMTARMIAKLLWLGTDDICIFIYSPIPGSSMANSPNDNIPKDYLGICWTPKWRKDYRKLSWIRRVLYAEYIILKLIFQPFAVARHLRNIKRKKFETKGEMGLSRLLANILYRHSKSPWGTIGGNSKSAK